MPHSNQSSTSSATDDLDVYQHYSSSLTDAPAVPPTHSLHADPTQSYHRDTAPPFGHGLSTRRSRDSSSSLANIPVPSFAAFRSQTPTLPSGPAGLGRQQQTGQASPRINSFAGAPSPRIADSFDRPLSIDFLPQRQVERGDSALHQTDNRVSFAFPLPPSHSPLPSAPTTVVNSEHSFAQQQHLPTQLQANKARDDLMQSDNHQHLAHPSISSSSSYRNSSLPGEEVDNRHSVISMQESQSAPSMTLETNGVQRRLTDETISSAGSHKSNTSQQRPKSPASKLGAFFGWKGSQDESSTTTFSEKSLSPLPSPGLRRSGSSTNMARLTPSGLDIQKANAQNPNLGYFDNPGTPLLLGNAEQNAHVQELEKELQHISTELANSIRREMELEDELERVKLEIPIIPQEGLGRRSSDYFSDSGASSARFPVSDADAQIEKVEALRRKAEQEKAQVQLEMAERLQTELGRRKELEQLVQDLEEQLQKKLDQADQQGDLSERIEELESTLIETRRLMGEERLAKDNFEVLYTATREELETQRNERDNLRDEIVPQLKARMEGLEADAEGRDGLVYENTRMQQELKQLLEEHRTLKEGLDAGTEGREGLAYENTRIQQELNQLLEEHRTLKERHETETEGMGGLVNENTRMQQEFKQLLEEHRALKERHETEIKGREGLEVENTRIQQELKQLLEAHGTLTKGLETDVGEKQGLVDKNTRMQQELQQLLEEHRTLKEGLEAEAGGREELVYENSRMQQELKQLLDEHRALKEGRFGSIAEEDKIMSPPLGPRAGLTRSGSLARSGSKRGGSLTRSGSLRDIGGRARSGSTNAMPVTGALNSEGVKEIEDQRDALHKALQLLIKRHDKQQKDHARAIKKLTKEKERAEAQSTPRRTHYQEEVGYLRDEVATLRKRTEDALEQKWQYEKGLSGLKIDLDRAEEETRGLRIIVEEQDVAPHASADHDVDLDNSLRLTLSNIENERDQALQLADSYRQRASQLQEASADSGPQPQAAGDLLDAAKRMDDLAADLEKQLQASTSLRQRFIEAVSKGEREQQASTRQIEEMQRRIASMEDSVLVAQQYSESTLSKHESEARDIEQASSPQLQRLHIHIPEPGKLSPTSPIFQSKSPRLSRKLSETSILEMSRTQVLERKVRELESLLKEAEGDMQAVVSRVNKSQYEVAELQGERDAALVQMRKLQNLVVQERERAEAVM